jgi:hypothetical protein
MLSSTVTKFHTPQNLDKTKFLGAISHTKPTLTATAAPHLAHPLLPGTPNVGERREEGKGEGKRRKKEKEEEICLKIR